ncbi:unnamed protein product, partial [Allacma fusca]
MSCKNKRVLKGSSEHKVERRRYLTQLVHEYTRTNSVEARRQIENGRNVKLVEFACGGLCNCSADDSLRQEIIDHGGIPLIAKHLSSSDSSTVISAIGSLIFLVTPVN